MFHSRFLASSFFTLSVLLLVHAHTPEPRSEREIEVQRALQSAAYHCAPAVAEFTAARKRAWAKQVLAGKPALPGYEDLFASGTYADQHPVKRIDSAEESLMACTPVEEVKIQNNSCVLTPVVTEGPYYHKAGHPLRQNLAEYQNGLLLLLDIGVIDVETCKPLPNVLVDIWMANATGHYAGHPDPAPHLINEKPQVGGQRSGLLSAFPKTKDHETFLRGAWPTNDYGVVQFTSIFPGYYTGRATHVHTKVFTSWEALPNGTFATPSLKDADEEVLDTSFCPGGMCARRPKAGKDSAMVHVGQFFFDDDINLQVDKMHPYSENPIAHTIGRTRNWRDSLNIFDDSHGPEGKYNPVFKVDLLGAVVSQGVRGYITMAVNTSARYDNFWKG